MRILRAAALASTLAAGLLLAACATPPVGTPIPESPTPVDETAVATELHAAWLDAGRGIGLVTYGSSSLTCMPVVEGVEADGQRITVAIAAPDPGPCTMDYVPQGTFVTLPDGVDASEDVEITLTGALTGSTTLDGEDDFPEFEEFAPSAGWYSETGFAVLTWGSSSCRPTVADVEATGEEALTVTFADLPADQPCTADMAPRIALAEVPEGFGDEDDVTLTLTGADVTGTTVILGDR